MSKREMTIKPVYKKIIAKRLIQEEASNIVLPDVAKEKENIAMVLRVGELVKTVYAGDRIYFKEHMVTEMTLGDKHILIMEECDVIGVIE